MAIQNSLHKCFLVCKIIDKWWIFECHVWLPEGIRSLCWFLWVFRDSPSFSTQSGLVLWNMQFAELAHAWSVPWFQANLMGFTTALFGNLTACYANHGPFSLSIYRSNIVIFHSSRGYMIWKRKLSDVKSLPPFAARKCIKSSSLAKNRAPAM